MTRLSLILFLSISLLITSCSSSEKLKEPISSEQKYKIYLKEKFNVVGNKVFLLPKIGCKPCLKEGNNFLNDKLLKENSNSLIVVITSDSIFYESLKSKEKNNIKIIYDNKRILDTNFEVDISNMTFLDFTRKNFKPVFTYPGFNYQTIFNN